MRGSPATARRWSRDVACPACRDFSRAYIRHLITQDEITGLRLLTVHNLHQVIELVAGARRAIVEGRFAGSGKSWRRRRPGPSTKLSACPRSVGTG